MDKEHIPVITDKEELYDKCENMEQLYDKYYLPLLDVHYRKTYDLQQQNQSLKEELKAVNKGLRKVLSKRKKWKYRYYKEKRKNRKALKYINECCYYPCIDSYITESTYSNMTPDEVENMIKILKGDDK